MKSKTHIFNSLFTRNNLRRLIASNNESVYTSVVKRYTQNFESKKNADLISEIYSELQDNYRNEYFYKNTLLNKLLLGVHSLNTTVALTEVPINKKFRLMYSSGNLYGKGITGIKMLISTAIIRYHLLQTK